MILRILFAFIFVLVLTILPLPNLLAGFRPPWVLLFVLYMQMCLPKYFNLILVFFMGLCLDVLSSTLMGQHVFAIFFATWVASTKTRRFNFFPLGQQMPLIFLFCFIYQALILLVDAFLGNSYNMVAAAGSACLGMVVHGVFMSKNHSHYNVDYF